MDIGATAIALGHYLSVVGAVVFAAAVGIDRFRAEVVLAGVLSAIVLISLAFLSHDLVRPGFFMRREEALDCACLGVTLSVACGNLIFERYETRRYKSNQNQKKYLAGALACLRPFQ